MKTPLYRPTQKEAENVHRKLLKHHDLSTLDALLIMTNGFNTIMCILQELEALPDIFKYAHERNPKLYEALDVASGFCHEINLELTKGKDVSDTPNS